ncbi:galactokinase [Qipengyuania sp. RANM35]|uniref:galactokinase n=1 Tax=Qipengyuania sp. RANM35 TaxID=3068635 RepID=UPI0034DAE719
MSTELKAKAARLFAERFGTDPEGVVFAPGRVNLIGEHVDYNDGLVLPMPVREGTAIAWARSEGTQFEVVAADFGEEDSFAVPPGKPDEVDWRSYVRGMVAESGLAAGGMKMLVTGDLSRGSGLSSSASLCVAVGRALAAASGREVSPVELAKAAQRTEHQWAGVACGIMDQMAVAAGEPGHAMLLDCRDLGYSLHEMPGDWAVVVTESGVTRGLVDGEYNARRVQCEAAAKALGIASLRDASIADVEAAGLDDLTRGRALHVVDEIARTRAAADALGRSDLAAFGVVLREGHASLRDLFEVSVPAVDAVVEELQSVIGNEGGARMTGGGFGGAVVAVLAADRVGELERQTGRSFLRVH